VCSRAVLEAVVKRKIPSPHRESKPRTPIVQPVAQQVFKYKATGKIFGPKKKEAATEQLKILHIKEHGELFCKESGI
jgi:hypothetical protein